MVLLEVKPVVGAQLRVVDGQQLGQVFIQAYYAIIEYGLQTVVCGLTDRVTWHFFKVTRANQPPSRALAASSLVATKGKSTSTTPPLAQPLLTVVWAKTESNETDPVAFMAKCLETEGHSS